MHSARWSPFQIAAAPPLAAGTDKPIHNQVARIHYPSMELGLPSDMCNPPVTA